MMIKADDFLNKYNMTPEAVDPDLYYKLVVEDMYKGLAGEPSDMEMIPTYLSNDGVVKKGYPVVVIDAGGTNFRCALVTFNEDGYIVEGLNKRQMPGIEKPATWDEFITFTADMIELLVAKTDRIGFCFSYSADITPEIDGKVNKIDKEVVITNSEGKLVGKSLSDELSRRGYPNRKVTVVNDTAAVLLGGSALLNKNEYGTFIGQVSGTGTNTCCVVSLKDIKKIDNSSGNKIIVNMESGLFNGIKRGYFDDILDSESNNPGLKSFEKMTAGVYIGDLVRLMIIQAANDGLLSNGIVNKLESIGKVNSAVIDQWASGDNLECLTDDEAEKEFVRKISFAMIDRSARCMCSNLIGIAVFSKSGDSAETPVCVCAEGSLVQKSKHYLPLLEKYVNVYGNKLGKYFVIKIGNESTLPGSAAAALLN